MDGDIILPDDHVVKYLSPTKWNAGIGSDWGALLPRMNDDGKASYNWMEFYRTVLNDSERMERIRTGIVECEEPLRLSANGAFVKLKVGTVHQRLSQQDRQVRFIHRPAGRNESHCEMEGLAHDDLAAGAILGECVIDSFPGKI